MTKTSLNIVLFLVLAYFPAFLFSQYTITGQILDEEQKPLLFADINLYTIDSIYIKGETSDENGRFTIKEQTGLYTLEIEYFGEALYSKKIDLKSNLDLGIITIQTNGILLSEAVITGNKPIFQQKYDKLIFNVENSPLKQGYDGLEVLQRSPKIQVSSKGEILLRNQSVLVLVNGRKMNLTGKELNAYLSSINSENIKNIEIQTVGSAETDASNAGGVINIVLKKIPIGFQTTVRTYQIYRNEDNQVYFGGINTQFGSEKWNIYNRINYTDNSDAYDYNSAFNFYQNNARNLNNGQSDSNNRNFNTTTGIVFYPNEKHEIGAELIYSLNKQKDNGLEFLKTYNPEFSATSTNNNFTKNNTDFWNVVFNYTYSLDSLGSNLKLITDIGDNRFNNHNEVDTHYTFGNLEDNRYRYLSDSDSKFYNVQTDWNQNLKGNWQLGVGVKLSNVSRKNQLNTYLFDSDWQLTIDGQQDFENKEFVLGSYVSIATRLKEKHQFKVGLRLEYADLKGKDFINETSVNQNYLDWFPNLYYSYEVGENKILSLTYSRRIDRPSFSNLNPFVVKQNDFLYQMGNPNLQPQYSNKLDITYQLKNQSFSLYGNLTNDLIAGVYTKDENNVSYYKPQNFGKATTLGIDHSFYGNIANWLYANITSGVANYTFKLNNTEHNRFSFYNTTYTQIKFSHSFFLLAFSNFSSKSQYLVTTGAMQYNLDLALQKNLWNGAGIVKLGCTDVFNTLRDKNISYYDNFDFSFYQKRISRAFSLSFTYTFKNNRKINNKNVQSENDNKNRF